MSKRRSKKSETLEVRLEHEVKSALMRKAHGEGRSTSAVVRSFIASYLADKPKEARSMFMTLWKPAAALGTASMAVIWAAVSPAPLHAKPDIRTVFQAIDRNGNGAISSDEFAQHRSSPAIQKLHDGHGHAGHEAMAAMHRANAQSEHHKPSDETLRSTFAKLDADSNASVTLEEFQAFHDQQGSHVAR